MTTPRTPRARSFPIVCATYSAWRSGLTVSGPGFPPVPQPTSVTHTFALSPTTRLIASTRLTTASGVGAYAWTAAVSNDAPAFNTAARNCGAAMPRWLVGSPAATISAFGSTLWIAADVVRSRLPYALGSGCGDQNAGMFGSFHTCHEVIGSFFARPFQNDPFGP